MNRLQRGRRTRIHSKMMFQKNMLILFCLTLLLSPLGAALGGPMGPVYAEESEGAMEITDVEGLNDMRSDLGGSYILGADIDLSDVMNWMPVGSEGKPFNGTFDGNSFKVTGMNQVFEGTDYKGIFGTVSGDASVESLNVVFKEETAGGDSPVEEESEDVDENESTNEEEVEGIAEKEGNQKVVLFSGIQPLANGDFASGDGTVADPFIIETAEQLNKVRENLTSHFKLNADIDLGVAPYNQGDGWEPLGTSGNFFRGSFDGNGYTISNVMINRPTEDNVGLFGYVTNGEIKSVKLVDIDITGRKNVGGLVGITSSDDNIASSESSGEVTGTDNIGGLVGYHNGTIEGSAARGKVAGDNYVGGLVGRAGSGSAITSSKSSADVTGTGNYIGGLVGLSNGTITKSSASGNVMGSGDAGGLVGNSQLRNITESFATGHVKGNVAGGLVGRLSDTATITDSYATGSVEGSREAGGLVGRDQSGTIINSYAIGGVNTPTTWSGGLIGVVGGNLTISDSFYDSETSGRSDDTGKGTPKTTTEMQTQATFINWDFDNIWDMPAGDYPRLQWEGIGGQPPVIAGDIIYVKEGGAGNEDGTSWANAFATSQEALDESTDGKQIWMAKGTYYPTKDETGDDNPTNARTKTFQMKNGVAIYGGFKGDEAPDYDLYDRDIAANETILSGDLGTTGDASDNAYHVFFHPEGTNLDETAVLDGVTITDGNANHTTSNPPHASLGGGMYNDKSSPTINNVTIKDNYAVHGGGVYNKNSNPTLSDTVISNNGAAHGAGINNYNSSPTLLNVTISENEAAGDSGGGGGMMNLEGSHPTLTNVKITDNKATGQYGAGGGIYNKDSDQTLTNVTITKNSASENGGGIYHSAGEIDMENVSIRENTSKNGAGIYSDGTVMMDGGDITENIATSGGGGITSENPTSKMTLTNVSVTANKANQGAGMRLQNGTEVSIIGGDINSNKTNSPDGFASNGGAIYMYRTDTDVTISGTEIKNNSAKTSGGGIYNLAGSLFLEDVILDGNTSGTSGGGLYSSGGKQKINGGEISNNTAASYGGGIANVRLNLAGTVYLSTTELENVHIHGNSAGSDGGGVYSGMDSTTILTDVTISKNEATRFGGGVYNTKSDDIEMNGGEITGNTSNYGGGMYNAESSPTITDVMISKNIATDKGGGIANQNRSSPLLTNVQISENTGIDGGGVANEYNSNPTLTNTLISENKSLDIGSGMFNNESSPTLINVTISNNIDGEGMYNFLGKPIIQNSIIWGHDESVYNDGSTPKITHSLIEGSGGSGANWVNVGTDEGGNLDANPKFVDAASGDYRLSAESPAINAGNDDFVPAGVTTDLAGNARLVDTVDMGAYEFPPIAGGDVTAIYVDEDDNEIAVAATHSGYVGETYTTVKKVIAGYTFKEVVGDSTGTFTTDEQEVKYVYTKDPDKEITSGSYAGIFLKTGWYDINDLPLQAKEEVSLDDGSIVELAINWNMVSDPVYDKDLEGSYLFTGEYVLIDGVSNPNGYRAQLRFVLTDAVVTVMYKDENGNKLADDVILKGHLNANYSTEEKEFDGYTLTEIPNNATGTFLRKDQTVTYVYSKNLKDPTFTVIVKHEDEVGKELTSDVILTGELDAPYETEAKEIDGYTLTGTPSNATGTFSSPDQIVTYVYKKDPKVILYDVIVEHVDEDGNELFPSETLGGELGNPYTTEAKEIDGYTLIETPDNATGTFQDVNQIVTYIYKKDPKVILYDVIVEHVDEDGNELFPSETLRGELGNPYTTEAKEIDGYTLIETPDNATGTFQDVDQTVTYVYEKNSEVILYDVLVEYMDEEGNTLAPAETLRGELDDPYTTEAKEIDGYTLTVTPENATGTFGSTDKTVTYVYKLDEATDKKDDSLVIHTTDDGSGQLPKTATSYYTMLLAGLLLTIIGGTAYFIVRRKRVL